MKHTILGAGGSIGNALAYELLQSNQTLRLVSRSRYSIPGTEAYRADLTSYQETVESVKDSDIAYLCVGLPYNTKIWEGLWPKIMQNTIDACKSTGTKLIFFDNVYMYGKVDGKMTETTPYNPCSKKGDLRAKITTLLENEIRQKNIPAMIARAADLYGPYITETSLPYILAFSRLLNGKKAQWMVDAKTMHSYSYTKDCARGLVLLAQNQECFNQVWHLPTHNPAISGEEFIKLAAKELGVDAAYSVLKKWMIKIAGLFSKTISESYEMLYQSEFDYYFDSTKFNNYFNYQPMTYEAGIHETMDFLKETLKNSGDFK